MRFAFLTGALLLLPAVGLAAAPKAYQVTGEVTAMTDETITVKKAGKETFEIARGEAAAEGGDLKVGSKVTVEYTMTAKSITVKEAKKHARR
jgi:hypothetical protein